MGARSAMTMRATVERPVISGTDFAGHPSAPSFALHLPSLPCRYWQPAERWNPDIAAARTVEDGWLAVPTTADIRQGDRITAIKDRLAVLISDAPLEVLTVIPKARSHKECSLRALTHA